MNCLPYKQQASFFLDRHILCLVAGSFLGYFFGIVPAGDTEEFFGLVPLAAHTPASFFWILAVMVFPLLLSASAVILHFSGFLPVIAFLKSACFTYCVAQIYRSVGEAGWLISSLLLFASGWNLPILFFFWFRHVHGEQEGVYRDFLWCVMAEILIAAADAVFVSPILAKIAF